MDKRARELLEVISAELEQLGEALPAPATEQDIAELREWVEDRYGAETPTDVEMQRRLHTRPGQP